MQPEAESRCRVTLAAEVNRVERSIDAQCSTLAASEMEAMSFHPSLQKVCEELLQEEALLSQQTESADAVRTPSDSSEGDPHSKGLMPPSPGVWWAKLICEHSPPRHPNDTVPERPVTILSACTGAAAEIAVFKAGGGFGGISRLGRLDQPNRIIH